MEEVTHIYLSENIDEQNAKIQLGIEDIFHEIEIIINGKEVNTELELYNLFRNYLHFPKYVENNLDALYDTLCDLSWLSEASTLIHIKIFNYDYWFNENRDFKLNLIELLNDVADNHLVENSQKHWIISIEKTSQSIEDLDELGLDYYY